MSKYFNKALFYKEWFIAKWLMLGLSFEIFYFWVLGLSSFFSQLKLVNEALGSSYNLNGYMVAYHPNDIKDIFERYFRYSGGSESANVIIFVSTLVIGAFIMERDRFSRSGERLASMTFTREQIIGTKWIVAMITVIVPMLVGFILMILIYYKNEYLLKGYSGINELAAWFLLSTLVYIFVVTFTMLIECLTGKTILGAVLSLIFLLLPSGLVTLITSFKYMVDGTSNLNLSTIGERLTISLYNIESYNNYSLSYKTKVLVLIFAIIVSIGLTIHTYKRYGIDKLGYICIFKAHETILKLGVSICFGLFLSIILVSAFQKGGRDRFYSKIVAETGFIIISIIVWFISDRLIKASKN